MSIENDLLTARIVSVQYTPGGRTYAYFTDDETIAVDDYVVVVAPNSNGSGWRDDAADGYPLIVRVASVEETVNAIEKVREWIVSKVDLSGYVAKKAAREKQALLRAKIQRVAKETRDAIDLAALAAANPKLQELLAELKGSGTA